MLSRNPVFQPLAVMTSFYSPSPPPPLAAIVILHATQRAVGGASIMTMHPTPIPPFSLSPLSSVPTPPPPVYYIKFRAALLDMELYLVQCTVYVYRYIQNCIQYKVCNNIPISLHVSPVYGILYRY